MKMYTICIKRKGERMILNLLEKEKRRLEVEIDSLHQQLKGKPRGKLICVHNGKYVKWYESYKGNIKYIKKSNRRLAEQLAIKKYILAKLVNIEKEKKAIESYINMLRKRNKESLEYFFDEECYQELLKQYLEPEAQELLEWKNQPYMRNPFHPENCIHKSTSGNIVRSKSELFIDMALYENRIPFRYECELTIGASIIYPDFTIKHNTAGKLIYWEHFGMIDNPQYMENALAKIKLYAQAGILPGEQLIMTFETAEMPLSVERINQVIRDYLL